MARTKAEFLDARSRDMDVVRKNGFRGWWTTARAKVIVVTHGFGDANRYAVRGGFIVQLWHGLPFKHLHLDSPSTYQVALLPDVAIVRRLLGWAYRRAGRAISLFPVASERVKPSIVSGFAAKPENVVVLGDVRDDVLLVPDAKERATERRAGTPPQAVPHVEGHPLRADLARRRSRPHRPDRRGVGRDPRLGWRRTTPSSSSATTRSGAATSAPVRRIRSGSS